MKSTALAAVLACIMLAGCQSFEQATQQPLTAETSSLSRTTPEQKPAAALQVPVYASGADAAGLDLDVASGYDARVESSARFSFSMNGVPYVTLYDVANQEQKNRAGLSRSGTRWTATVSFPAAGRYTVWVGAPRADGQGWSGVARLPYDVQSGSELVFPRFYWDRLDKDLALDVGGGYKGLVGASTKISFTMEGVPYVSLYDANDKEVESRAGLSRSGNRWTAAVSFPSAGRYTVWISAPRKGEQGWRGVASLPFDAQAGSEIVFPRFYWDRLSKDLPLDAANGYRGRVGGSIELSFEADTDSSVGLYTADGEEVKGRTDLARVGNTWTARVYFPAPGRYAVWIRCSQPGAEGQRGVASLLYDAQAAGELPALKAGGNWARARQVENMSWSVDKDPEAVRLTPLVKSDPAMHLASLVKTLVAGKADDFERVRAIHDWVAKNVAYDYAAFKGLSPKITQPYDVIRHGSSVCYGYSQVFFLMCSLAGIDCRVVSGYGRGIGFSVFDPQTGPFKSNHAWNAVQIDDGWYLVDSTWDAGYIDGKSDTFTWRYNRSYLFTPPEVFLCTHFPEDPRWQLQPQPIGDAQLGRLPRLDGQFGRIGFTQTGLALVTEAKTKHNFSIGTPEGWEITGYLTANDAALVNPGTNVRTSRKAGTTDFVISFPFPGSYTFSLSARRAGEARDTVYVGSLYFVAKAQ